MQWLAQFIIVYSLPYMISGIKFGTFYFFGGCTLVALAFACLFVPETKGVPLEKMDLLFGEGVSVLATRARRNYCEAGVGVHEKASTVHVDAHQSGVPHSFRNAIPVLIQQA